MNYNIEYISSGKIEVQGSKSEIFKKYGKEWHKRTRFRKWQLAVDKEE